MLYAAAFYLALIAIGAAVYWRQRHDFWLYAHSASLFAVGESIDLSGIRGPYSRGVVLRVTRSALLVRPVLK